MDIMKNRARRYIGEMGKERWTPERTCLLVGARNQVARMLPEVVLVLVWSVCVCACGKMG